MDRQTVTFEDKQYQLDEHGFLDPPEQWDEDFAKGMAKSQGILEGLTEDHWKTIDYLRQKFLEEQTVPVIVKACHDLGYRLKQMRDLFPAGYHRGACKIAGINHAFISDVNAWLTYETPMSTEVKPKVEGIGFLLNFDDWTERFAHWVVRHSNLPEGLTDKHWRLIHYLRDYYRERKNIPTVYEACRANDIELEELAGLFPQGYRRGACRAAGIPFFG
jgi:tRNA 2-thiouridine synthesizing protein E